MNTFHSSGTASGNVEKMWTWKITIPTTAIVNSGPLGETSSSSGSVNSITVPMCAASAPVAEGSRSSGCSRQSRRLTARERFHGVLLIITVTTNGKCRFSFEDGGAPPDADEHDLRGDDQIGEREQEDDHQVPVDLRAGGQERDLVAQPEQDAEREQHPDRDRVQPPGGGAGGRRGGGEQQVDGRRRAARRTARRRCRVRRVPRVSGTRSGHGGRRVVPGPQPVEHAADHRREAQRQRHRAGAQAEHLPEHRPHDRLLEDDRFRPPAAQVAEPAEAVRRRGDHAAGRRARRRRS